MADITRRLIWRHLQAAPTTYVQRMRKGAVVEEGPGRSFWYRPLKVAISELPIDERELPLLFHARTRDFQDVSVQATVTYRIADPARAAQRIDFSIDPQDGHWRATPLEQLGGLITELAQQYAVAVLAQEALTHVMVDGFPALRAAIAGGLGDDERLAETGLEVVGVRVVAIRPDADLEQALQTPVRQLLQEEADKATFERRARAVEQERAIGENELQNQIELARRTEHLVEQQGANERKRVIDAADARRIDAEARAEQVERNARAKATDTRLVGEATNAIEAERLAVYEQLGEATLMGLALKELASNLPDIDTLVLTPDLLTPLITRFLGTTAGDEPAALAVDPAGVEGGPR